MQLKGISVKWNHEGNNMDLLIIGGSGILSSAVVDEAIYQGINVTMVNRGRRHNFLNPKAELVIGDIRKEPQALLQKLGNRHFDTVIDFIVWNVEQLSVSLSLFSNLADQYIFISSAQAYNTSINGILTEKSEKVQPLWKYSVNKYEAECFLINYCKKNKKNYTIIRPGVNYGSTRIPYGIFPEIGKHWTFVERIIAGKIIPTWNNGENKLNLTRVEDFALGTVALVGNKKAYNEDFNVVGDNVYIWRDVLVTLGKLIGKEVKTIDVPVEFYAKYLTGDDKEALLGGRAHDLVCSNEKLKTIIPSFCTRFDLETGLRMTLEAYENNEYYLGIDYSYEGVTDRMLNDYRKNHFFERQCFKNYFHKNCIKNHISYLRSYYQDSELVKTFSKVKRMCIH